MFYSAYDEKVLIKLNFYSTENKFNTSIIDSVWSIKFLSQVKVSHIWCYAYVKTNRKYVPKFIDFENLLFHWKLFWVGSKWQSHHHDY